MRGLIGGFIVLVGVAALGIGWILAFGLFFYGLYAAVAVSILKGVVCVIAAPFLAWGVTIMGMMITGIGVAVHE